MKLSVNIKKKLSNFDLKVSFSQESGVLSLLGSSGSGKSMTLKCIAGLVKPDKGKIMINDKVLFDSEKNINLIPQKRNIGYVFQNYALFPHMTVLENISIGLNNMSKKEKEILCKVYIDKFKLNNIEKNYPHELSGGQCQRVALARALITKPDILLLDEPFSALDSYLKSTIEADLINIINEFSGIVIYVTHDISECYRVSDNIITYNNGTALKSRNKKDLFNSPRNVNEAILTGIKNIYTAKKLDDNNIYCIDLGYTIKFESKVPEDLTNICIKSNNLSVSSPENKLNTFKFKIINIIENPFTYTVLLKNPDSCFEGILECTFEKTNFRYNVSDIIYINFTIENLIFINDK